MSTSVELQQITGSAKSISELFSPIRHFTVEYYQREYAWTTTNVEELINDLTRNFLSDYVPGHPRESAAGYSPYFLGPIVTYSSGGKSYLVDGQQRISTLTLLLIHLKQISDDSDQAMALGNMVYSGSYGRPRFRMDVEDRTQVMHTIWEGGDAQPAVPDASSSNIWDRYQDIKRLFPDELVGPALPYFIDWLSHRVVLVEVVTPDKNMALEIFESMNDRGLQLSNMDMLKSFLLSRIEVPERIEAANKIWRDCVNDLRDVQKNGDSEFMKTFVRAKYAQTIRESGKGTTPKHFEDIGTAFHKWIREQTEPPTANRNGTPADRAMSFHNNADFETFVINDFLVQSRRYIKLLTVSQDFTPGWEYIYYNARNDFTLQYLVLVAASEVDDTNETFRQKSALIAKFIDLMIARRMVNFKRRGYSSMYRPMFALAKDVRGLDLDQLRKLLADRAAALEEQFTGVSRFALTNMNKSDVHYLLARMTSWLEDDRTDKYFKGGAASEPFEVEHVWANKYERHIDEFPSENDFQQTRNKFAGLLLLPKSFNASYGAMPYEAKVEHYVGQNALAKTLALGVGSRDPNARRKAAELSVTITAHPHSFQKADLEARQELYRAICERIWDLSDLGLAVQE